MKSLSIILDDINIVLPQRDLDNEQKKQFSSIIEGCHNVFNTLRDMLKRYQEFGSDPKSCDLESLRNKIQRGWKRLKWKPEAVGRLRSRISSNISLFLAFYEGLAVYVSTPSLILIEAQCTQESSFGNQRRRRSVARAPR